MGYLREPLPTAIVFSTLITPLNDSHVCHVPDSFLEHVVVCVARWELKGNAYECVRPVQACSNHAVAVLPSSRR